MSEVNREEMIEWLKEIVPESFDVVAFWRNTLEFDVPDHTSINFAKLGERLDLSSVEIETYPDDIYHPSETFVTFTFNLSERSSDE